MRLVTAIAIALVIASCGPGLRIRPLRFGDLEPSYRAFHFEHDIELFEAKNGLTIALLPDARTNLVTVDVRYQVGAAEDPEGRAGMAHLVEHLLFLLRATAGGPTLGDELGDVTLEHNAWTTWDETHFTEVALAEHLPAVLAIEARRMAATCDQLDDALFARERDVVLAEEAQRHDETTTLREELSAALWGADHPYARAIGSRQIADVTRDEVCAFIAAHYAPDRAILVVTGNFDIDQTSRSIATQLGTIVPGEATPRVAIAPPRLGGRRSEHVADVDQATALVFFETPPWGAKDTARGDAVGAYLGAFLAEAGDDVDWVTDTSIARFGGNRAPVLIAAVSVDDAARLEEAVTLIYDSAARLTEQANVEASLPFVRGVLRGRYAGGYENFRGRGASIADYLQYTTHKLFFISDLVEIDTLSAAEISPYARDHLDRKHSDVALIRPSGAPAEQLRATIAVTGREHDLQPWRTPVDVAEAAGPLTSATTRVAQDVRELELANGLRVLLAPDPRSVLVDVRLVFPAGTSADPADRPGVASAAAELLGPDYGRSYLRGEIRTLEWALDLGTQLATRVDEESTTFAAGGLAVFADWHVWRLFWLLDAGVYADDEIEGLHRRARRAAAREPAADDAAATLRASLFGADHPYAAAHHASELAAIRARDLQRFRAAHYGARGATLIVSGAFDPDKMIAEIETLFGPWPDDARAAAATVPSLAPARGPTWIAVHDDARAQVHATIAFAAASDRGADRAARLILAAMLQDRVRVVRDGYGASYGVEVGYGDGLGGGVLSIDGDLDPDRAGKALTALLAELARIRDQPDDVLEDFVRARRRALALVLADAAGTADVANELHFAAIHHLPVGYLATLAATVGATTPDDITALAALDLDQARMVVLVRGPAARVDAATKAAGGTKVQVVDE